MKEYPGEEDPDLLLVDKEAIAAEKAKVERQAALAVPGMIKPSELNDDEDL